MKKHLLYFLLLVSCMSSHKVMTMSDYSSVDVGTTEKQLVAQSGEPYSKKSLEGGKMQYQYIERIEGGSRIVEERHYFFIIENGKVVNKYVKDISPPPYLENSYDMQTTHSESEGES